MKSAYYKRAEIPILSKAAFYILNFTILNFDFSIKAEPFQLFRG